MFEAEGVEYMFGNPGTSEAPMMAVMDQYPSIEYVLVLQEGVAVGLAEGYARSTGKVPLVSLHIDNGMSNGLSLMIDQLYSGTPMVMTAGNKDIRKLASGRSDLANMARPYAKWGPRIRAGFSSNRTLCHYDVAAKNLSLPKDPFKPPVFFDWSLVTRGSIGVELGQVVAYSLSVEEHHRIPEVLDDYLEAMRELGVAELSRDTLWNDVRYGHY
jgi:hypothetical protein